MRFNFDGSFWGFCFWWNYAVFDGYLLNMFDGCLLIWWVLSYAACFEEMGLDS